MQAKVGMLAQLYQLRRPQCVELVVAQPVLLTLSLKRLGETHQGLCDVLGLDAGRLAALARCVLSMNGAGGRARGLMRLLAADGWRWGEAGVAARCRAHCVCRR